MREARVLHVAKSQDTVIGMSPRAPARPSRLLPAPACHASVMPAQVVSAGREKSAALADGYDEITGGTQKDFARPFMSRVLLMKGRQALAEGEKGEASLPPRLLR